MIVVIRQNGVIGSIAARFSHMPLTHLVQWFAVECGDIKCSKWIEVVVEEVIMEGTRLKEKVKSILHIGESGSSKTPEMASSNVPKRQFAAVRVGRGETATAPLKEIDVDMPGPDQILVKLNWSK